MKRAKAVRSARASERKTKKLMSAQSARAQRFEVLGRDGAWKQAAQEMVRVCQQPILDYLPPAYAALSLPACLSMTSQMYECLEQAEWRTSVVCWWPWYDPPQDYRCGKCAAKDGGEPASGSLPLRVLHLYALVGTGGSAPTPLHMRPVRLVLAAPPPQWAWGKHQTSGDLRGFDAPAASPEPGLDSRGAHWVEPFMSFRLD